MAFKLFIDVILWFESKCKLLTNKILLTTKPQNEIETIKSLETEITRLKIEEQV